MRRREVITLLGAAAGAWPIGRGRSRRCPSFGFSVADSRPNKSSADLVGFRKGLTEAGYIENQNVAIEYPVGRKSI